ncbi:hypothetical protein N7539_006230 [Penicillium diatomitis]|uniref:Methyltransferase type 11 domain-containing protein n=1 Tax=Penicillium diatomitis TaxID=2819901 RepID=A0A9X0BT51_9EURO|nr:uncharacterized protein N7539_006230 [Penicillium diatomitis]KAJ5482784.1 hypothetical protein N7539_006230 [Penicillium diatomitis]
MSSNNQMSRRAPSNGFLSSVQPSGPGLSSSVSAQYLRPGRPHRASSTASLTTKDRGPAAEDVQGGITALPPLTRPIPNSGQRMSSLPRPSLEGARSISSPASTVSPLTPASSMPSSLSSPGTTPSSLYPSSQQPLTGTATPKRARNVLRRKAPTIGTYLDQGQSQKLSLVIPSSTLPIKSGGVQRSTPVDTQAKGASRYQSKKESAEDHQRQRPKIQEPIELASLRTNVDKHSAPPSTTTHYPSAGTPSTRYSESPGAPSIWSRGSTPTSLSSYSPGIINSSKFSRMRQPSPSQPRLPLFSAAPTPTSPESRSAERSASKTQRSGLPRRSLGLGSATIQTVQGQGSRQTTSSSNDDHPDRPSQQDSQVDCSPPRDGPSKNPEIDIDEAREEVEEVERELSKLQRVRSLSVTRVEAPKVPQTPPRPSREGTHQLELETSPVIRSNLPYLKSTGHKRRESMEAHLSALSQSTLPSTESLLSTGNLSGLPSREINPQILARKSPKTLTKEPPLEGTDANASSAPKRFGFFSRKTRTNSEVTSEDKTRAIRKGPAAGTGHEGYGRYSSQRGRHPSSGASGTRARSTSTNRSTSQSATSRKGSTSSSRPDLDLDDFLSSRLEPVIINGGGMDGASLSRTVSEQSISSMSVTSSNLPRLATLTPSTVQSTESLATSTGTTSDPGSFARTKNATSANKTRAPLKTQPSSERRTSRSRMPVPKGTNSSGFYSLPSAATTSTSLSGNTSNTLILPRLKPAPAASEQPPKAVRSEPIENRKEKTSRWNLFQRGRVNESSVVVEPQVSTASQTASLHAAISPALNRRPVAHYALVDTDSDEIDDIIGRIENSPPTEEERYDVALQTSPNLDLQKKADSTQLQPPPLIRGETERFCNFTPKTTMGPGSENIPQFEDGHRSRRPQRLASVGRIPQVVSRRDRHHMPGIHSFSRPFSVAESPSVMAPVVEPSYGHDTLGGLPWTDNQSKPGEWGHGFNPAFSAPEAVSALEFLAGPFVAGELLQFSPHKGSVSSASSEATAAVTAVLPRPGTAPTEDEIWNEYDDLIDHVLSPETPAPKEPATNEESDRFEMATSASKALQDGLNRMLSDQPRPASIEDCPTTPDGQESPYVRRSTIVSALEPPLAPSTQASYSNLIASYGDPEVMYSPVQHPTRPPPDPVHEQQSNFLQSLAATHAPNSRRHGRGEFPGCSEREWDAVTHINMRSASLMTSRWLSFGRVLFSPAHNHVKSGTHGRILVIDGLGNDDWSFYCSLTYPDAEVYSLSGRPVSTATPHPAAWQPPANHHTVYHAGLQNPLPFPKDYFTVAVLRFPAASSEAVQSNIIQECRRVLRSGGYLEMSLLDRDLVNVGARTRKAIRRLKETTYLTDSAISLKPASDSVQRLLGTQGFDNLRRCMVSIPVAGMVVRSSGSTTSSSDKSMSASAATTATTASTQPAGASASSPMNASLASEDNPSLGDLLSDPSPSAANDESIAKIVARVGRWWYTKCYEEPALHHLEANDRSVWNDRKVLRECQKRGTGFRMLIAYAQKPSQKRRTASV